MARKTNGETIRTVRQALGIRQASLAARTGISKSWLCEIELGGKQPSAEMVQRIAAELGISVDAITYPVPEEMPA